MKLTFRTFASCINLRSRYSSQFLLLSFSRRSPHIRTLFLINRSCYHHLTAHFQLVLAQRVHLDQTTDIVVFRILLLLLVCASLEEFCVAENAVEVY